MGILLTIFPGSGLTFGLIGLFLAIFGAILIQVHVEFGFRKFLTFSIPTTLGLIYFFVISPELVVFLLASAAFISIQGLYYAMRKFKESI
jgi:hypothetical protein